MKGMGGKTFGFFLMGAILILSLGGCGTGQESDGAATVSVPSNPANSQDIKPDIHTNVPPPNSLSPETAEDFFDKKDAYDSFSPELRNQIAGNMAKFQQGGGGSGSSGSDGADADNADDSSAPVMMTMMGGTVPEAAFNGDCDVTAEFICVDAPQPLEGLTDIFTTEAGIDLTVRIDLNQLAVFSSTDPVAVVSVFNSDAGAAGTEILIMPEDVKATGVADVGSFQTAIPLGGGGKFTVVVSAYRVLEVDGEITNQLASKSFTVFRTSSPEIEFVEARPVSVGADGITVGEPVAENTTISSERLQLKVALISPFSPGIQVRFENYDEAGFLTGFDAVGDTASKKAVSEGSGMVYTGQVILHSGLNRIRMVGLSPELEERLGSAAPAPTVLSFDIYNFFGEPRIKIINPAQALVPQTAQNSAKVGIEFCYTLVPDLIDIGLVGTPPVFSDECVTGPLGFSVNVYVNGRQVGGDDDPHQDALPNFNPASGIFTARVTPDFGVNVFQIEAKRAGADTPFAVDAGSFIFGTPLALITDGQRATEGLFTPRGINLDIDKALVEGDIKDMILKFVNRPQTSDLILSTFKKEAATAVSSCTEVDPPTRSGGSVSVEFIPETFSLGSVELLSFTTANDGMLHLSARINGMHGEADMIDLNAPTVTYGGKQINFVPLTISIARMDVTLGVAFRKTHEGNLQLDLKRISEQEVVEAIGDGPLGSMVSVNADRNPYAAGFEFLDQQQGLVRKLFNDTLETTFLCGIENGLNNNLTGIFGKGANDIELINSNPNAFRLPLAFDFLGKHFPIDVALNVPRGEIEFDSEGIHVRDVPVRINPNLNELNSLASLHTEGVLASVSRFMTSDEPGPQRNITTDIHKVGLLLGEDAINQALFTANLMGLLDLDVDADFYAQTGFTPTSRLLPLGSMFLTNQVDVNMDGNDQNDAQVPVLLKIRTDKSRPPMLSFLSEAETTRLVAKEQALIDDAGNQDPSGGTDTREPRFKSGSRYFRLAASGLEIAVFEQEPKPEAGATTFCNVPVPTTDNANLTAKGFCPVAADARTLKPMEQVTAEGGQCAPDQTFDLPKANGDIISRSVLNPDFAGDPVPLYRVKLGLVLHGEFKGVNREVPAVDRVKLSADELKAKNIFRIKLIPGDTGLREAHVTSVEVLENHTGQPDLQIVNLFEDFFSAAVGTDCSMFNEVKVPLPDQFAFDTEKEGLIKDLGLESLDLGLLPEQFPQVFIDDNRLFLDVLLFADLKFVEGGTSPGGNI